MNSHIDLIADLNDEDDEGLGWSMLSDASDPARIRPGAMLVAGNRQAQAVVRVVAVDDDGQVHFTKDTRHRPLGLPTKPAVTARGRTT